MGTDRQTHALISRASCKECIIIIWSRLLRRGIKKVSKCPRFSFGFSYRTKSSEVDQTTLLLSANVLKLFYWEHFLKYTTEHSITTLRVYSCYDLQFNYIHATDIPLRTWKLLNKARNCPSFNVTHRLLLLSRLGTEPCSVTNVSKTIRKCHHTVFI